MVEKCVVFGCSNSRNVEKGISMHKIPYESFWCPFLTSQLRKCQISDALAHKTKICPAGLKARKNSKISVTFSAHKKKDSIFLKKNFESEFFTDMEIYQKETN